MFGSSYSGSLAALAYLVENIYYLHFNYRSDLIKHTAIGPLRLDTLKIHENHLIEAIEVIIKVASTTFSLLVIKRNANLKGGNAE